MPTDPQRPKPTGDTRGINMRWLGYLGLVIGAGAIVLTVDSGSVAVLGLSVNVSVPIIAALAFLGGILGGRFGPKSGDL